jgi:serine/threonine-protein kinase HipA
MGKEQNGRENQLELAFEYSDKLSFSGVQPKLNAKCKLQKQQFEVTTKSGDFILKLPHAVLQELPQNEDFAQLAGLSKESKYDFSMEQLIFLIEKFSTFPSKDKETLFNFLVGNEDMHLKNFSMIRDDEVTSLTPAYDLINSTIVMNSKEEIALPLNGKKSNLKKRETQLF